MKNTTTTSTYSITKYDPIHRNDQGHYMRDEWTEFSDINKTFDGKLLTREEYLRVEERYIDAALKFLSFNGCQQVVVKKLEKYEWQYPEQVLDDSVADMKTIFEKVHEGSIIPLGNLPTLIKMILRGVLWAELFCSSNDEVALTFGYDLYMYFTSSEDMTELLAEVEEMGLFVY